MERVVRRRKKGTKTLFSISFWDFSNQYQRQQNSLKKIALNRVLSGTVFLKKNFVFPIMFSELRIGPLYQMSEPLNIGSAEMKFLYHVLTKMTT